VRYLEQATAQLKAIETQMPSARQVTLGDPDEQRLQVRTTKSTFPLFSRAVAGEVGMFTEVSLPAATFHLARTPGATAISDVFDGGL
jgi:hypothetical protein